MSMDNNLLEEKILKSKWSERERNKRKTDTSRKMETPQIVIVALSFEFNFFACRIHWSHTMHTISRASLDTSRFRIRIGSTRGSSCWATVVGDVASSISSMWWIRPRESASIACCTCVWGRVYVCMCGVGGWGGERREGEKSRKQDKKKRQKIWHAHITKYCWQDEQNRVMGKKSTKK